MDPPSGSSNSKAPTISRHISGPPFLRHYVTYDLVAWQPRGTLDDVMLDQIAQWLVTIEKGVILLRRFIDFNELTGVAITTDHLFEFALKRAKEFPGKEAVRTALFCEEWVGFGIARMYESLMQETLIEARAFRDRNHAAEWLKIPGNVLELKDEPAPPTTAHDRSA